MSSDEEKAPEVPVNSRAGNLGIGPETFPLLVGTRHWQIQYPLAVFASEVEKTP
jgi:hypothetical protein